MFRRWIQRVRQKIFLVRRTLDSRLNIVKKILTHRKKNKRRADYESERKKGTTRTYSLALAILRTKSFFLEDPQTWKSRLKKKTSFGKPTAYTVQIIKEGVEDIKPTTTII